VVQAFRSLGLPQSVKERARGYDEATFVESFVLLHAAGGEGPEDFKRLRGDAALAEMIGHELPSPAAALQFLYAFHADAKIAEAQPRRLLEQLACIPEETRPLQGLGRVNGDLVQRCGGALSRPAHRHDYRKPQALPTSEGGRGYQPMLAVGAETGRVLADPFRDGKVAGDDGTAGSRAGSLLPPRRGSAPRSPSCRGRKRRRRMHNLFATWPSVFVSSKASCSRTAAGRGISRCCRTGGNGRPRA
jgi:hypothetical protein